MKESIGKISFVYRERARWVVFSEGNSVAMSLLSPYGATKVKVSHETLDWRIF